MGTNVGENTEKYAYDFPPEAWSEKERFCLEPFTTNMEGHFYVLRNLPPEVVGALCSRASRASKSLLRVLLEECLLPILNGEDKEAADKLREALSSYKSRDVGRIIAQWGRKFYAKWYAQYGDDSIAQMTGAHGVFWGVSQVAMKFIEDQRVGLEPIEKSTRYVNFSGKVGGKYLYYVPGPDLERMGLLDEYTKTLDGLFDAYAELQPKLFSWLRANYEEKDAVLEKKSFDALRGLLPMATLGQVAFRGNAQAFEYLINRTAAHPLGELRWISGAVKNELDKEIPSLLLRLEDEKSKDYQAHLARRRVAARGFIGKNKDVFGEEVERVSGPVVKLVEYDEDAELKIAAGIIFPLLHISWETALAIVRKLKKEELEEIFSLYFADRNARWQKTGRALENSYMRFEIVMNIGAYRDLHRHRMLTQDRQFFSVHHGYDIPKEIIGSGLEKEFRAVLDGVAALFGKLEKESQELAQYVVPLAYRMRFYQWHNFRELFWETELRTISQGHPDYRHIEQQKYLLAKEKFPIIGKFMLVDMNNYEFARRGTEEQIKKKEEKILEGLRKKD
ncbi:MAG: FAD-dependent thymidylate synthase [bacterium]|nr:FAD-dependent thymidylate synthase [bacterium]